MDEMSLDLQSLRCIVRRIQNLSPVAYHPVDGVTCPLCVSHLNTREMGVTCTRPWQSGCRERYHTCPVCGTKFKSVEPLRAA